MFKVGDTVRNVAANVVGVVVETDGDTVYFEQENGAEVDFPASALVLEDDFQAGQGTSVRDDPDSRANDPVYDAVLGELYPAVLDLGRAVHAAAKSTPGAVAKSWEALSALQKLNAISVATDVPVQTWVDSGKPGAKTRLGPLQLSVLAGRSRKPPR